jgi:hypothetical protein
MNKDDLHAEVPQTTTCGDGHTITLVVSGQAGPKAPKEPDSGSEPPSAPESTS